MPPLQSVAAVRASEVAGATAWLTLFVLLITGSALLGSTALGPERWMDFDALYRVTDEPIVLFGDLTPIAVDLPRDLSFARSLHAGRLANWNPLSACGAPLWAEQGGPFFPLKLPFYLAPSPRTYDLFLALRLIAAGLGAYLLARYRGRAHLAALAAAATFELSGALIEMVPFGAASPPYLLPWVLLGAAAIARRRDGVALAGAAVALGAAASGGHPTLILLVFAAFAAALVGHLIAHVRTPRRALAIALWGGLAVLLGLALAAPSLLPLAELTRLSASYKFRPMGILAYAFALAVSRHALPIGLFAPGLLGAVQTQVSANHIGDAALGVAALVLAVAGVLRRGLDPALLAVGFLGVVLTTSPPGLTWLAHLPGLGLLLPSYAWALVALPLTQAIGTAVEQLADAAGRRAALLALVLVLAASSSLLLVEDLNPFVWGLQPFGWALRNAVAAPAGLVRLVVPPLLTAAALGGCYALRGTRLRTWCPLGFVVLAVGEPLLLWTPWLQHPRSQVLTAAPSPAVRVLQEGLADADGRFVANPITVGHGLTPMFYGLADLRGVSALPVKRFVEYMRAADPQARILTIDTIPRGPSPLLDLAAVRYLVMQGQEGAPPPLTSDDPQMPLVYRDANLAIDENRAALPRARIVHRVTPVADQTAAGNEIRRIGTEKAHAADVGLADTVLLEPAAEGSVAPPVSVAAAGEEWVRIVDHADPDALRLDAQLAAPGMVVLADTYYPGWSATVDDAAAPIYPANLLFRAVYVPAGRHAIAFRYAPRSLTYGWWIALAAGTACVALALAARRSAEA